MVPMGLGASQSLDVVRRHVLRILVAGFQLIWKEMTSRPSLAKPGHRCLHPPQ